MIGANAVVTGEIHPYTVAVGIPARVIREIRPSDQHGPHNPGAIPLANPERARDVAGRTGKSDHDTHTTLGS